MKNSPMRLLISSCFLILASAMPTVTAEVTPEARGIWLSRDVVLDGPKQMEAAFYKLAQANFNRIFINVHYQGSTIYPGEVMAAAGGPSQRPEFIGRDPLQEAIELGHKWKLEVIAWFEYGLMAHHSGSDTADSGPILSRHPDWQAIARDGTSFLKNQYGVFHWLDPAHPQVVAFMEDLFGEIAEKYPKLDGIETDRIRYPSYEFSYSAISRHRYMVETGGIDPIHINSSHPQWQNWINWREQQTTTIARRIYHRVKQINPGLLISAAVAPPYMLNGHEKLQAWDAWADSGYVDALEPMLYVTDTDLPYQLSQVTKCVPPSFHLYPGIAYQNDRSIQNQIIQVRKSGFNGMTIWYYGDLVDKTIALLTKNCFSAPASLPHDDVIIDNSNANQFKTTGTWVENAGGYLNAHLTSAPGVLNASASWYPHLVKSAVYQIYARWPGDIDNTDHASYRIGNGDKMTVTTVDQRQDSGGWFFLLADSFGHNTPAYIQLVNDGNGKLAADAVRWVISPQLELLDINIPDSQQIELKFNHRLDSESATTLTNYKITDAITVTDAYLNPADAAILILVTTPLIAEQSYTLTIAGLENQVGYLFPSQVIQFQYVPEKTCRIIDNMDANFKLFGNWTSSTGDPGYWGNDFLMSIAGNGENRAQWWGLIEQDGYYEIAARWPMANGAIDVPFSILHNFAIDTVSVNQQINGGRWNNLGTFYYQSGKTASVMVTNNVDQGLVLADAVRFRRTLEITDVTAAPGARAIMDYQLYQNFPNPFNPVTTIKFQLPGPGRATLKVYNLLGVEIATLVDEDLSAGANQVKFNGSGLPTGVYFYRLKFQARDRLGGVISSKKMVLMD